MVVDSPQPFYRTSVWYVPRRGPRSNGRIIFVVITNIICYLSLQLYNYATAVAGRNLIRSNSTVQNLSSWTQGEKESVMLNARL